MLVNEAKLILHHEAISLTITFCNPVQPEKASLRIDLTLTGMVNVFIPEQFAKALFPISFSPSGKKMEVKLEQS